MSAGTVDPEFAAYSKCVTLQAVRLSTGSDAADLIAKNAAAICGQTFLKSFENYSGALMTALEDKAVRAATIAILEARAKNK